MRHSFKSLLSACAAACTALALQPMAQAAGDLDEESVIVTDLQAPQIFSPIEGLGMGITDCLQDDRGFIWVATDASGIIRWNGQETRTYERDFEDSSQMKSSYVTQIATAPGGKLWIGTGDAGVSVLDLMTDQFTHYSADEKDKKSLSSDGVTVLFVDSTGRVWVGGSDGVLNRFNPESNNFQRYYLTDEMEAGLSAIAEDAQKRLWIGTGGEGLFLFDPESGDVVEQVINEGLGDSDDDSVADGADGSGDSDAAGGLASDTIYALLVDRDGLLWIGTDRGLNRFDPEKKEFAHYRHINGEPGSLADDLVRVIFQDRGGVLWIGTDSGLHELSDDRRSVTRYVSGGVQSAGSLYFPRRLTCALQDRAGVLYFSDYTSAMFKVTPGRRSLKPYRFEMSSMVNPKPGIIWGGTFGRGPLKLDLNKKTMTWYPVLGDPADPEALRIRQWILATYHDKRNRLWFGGQGLGLVQFNTRTNEYKQFRHDEEQIEGITSNDVNHIIPGPDGSLWIATFGGGLNRFYPKSGLFMDFMQDPADATSLSSNYLYTLTFDRKDANLIWIGTARGGLNRFNINKEKFLHYSLAPQGSAQRGHDNVLCIYQDQNGIVWLGTDGGGMVRFDPQSQDKRYFGVAEGLPQATVYGILPGSDGELWLSTYGGGLARFDPGKPSGEQFQVYGMASGLIGDSFNQNGYGRMLDGRLMFGAANITYFFDPREVKPDDHKPPVVLTGFKIFNKEVKQARPIWSEPEVHLDYTDSVFSFEFAALSFAAPSANTYRYKLDGLHDWIETKQTSVTYTNVDGGDYTFRVKAANHDGVWGDKEIALKLTVAAPPWKTWWAYTLYVLAVIGLIVAYQRYQARRIQALRDTHRLQTVEHELQLTGAVQTGFLPEMDNLDSDMFGLQGFYRPADRASGDWWWYESSGDDLLVLIGDVTGHGAGPAMVTAAAAATFRTHGDVPLVERLRIVNEEVCRVAKGQFHMTLTSLAINGQTGKFVHHSAGGQPVMRLPIGGRPRLVPCPGTPLGTSDMSLGCVEGELAPGEQLVVYTDGIPELPMPNGRLLGMRRFSKLLEEARDLPLDHAAGHVVGVADALRENRPQDDDWTFAIIQWKKTQPGSEVLTPGPTHNEERS